MITSQRVCTIGGRRDRGISLIENMIALGVFASGMTAVVTLTDEIVYTNQLSDDISASTTLARNVFEDIRTRDPEDRIRLGITSGTTGPVNGAGKPSASGRYVVDWEFVKEEPHEGLEMLTISVNWTDPKGHARTSVFHSGMREGWPVPVIIPETSVDHEHGLGHLKK